MDYNVDHLSIHSIYIELLSKCNLHCPYCYNNSDYQRETELDYTTIIGILDDAKGYSAKIVYLSGGEPTLYTNLAKLVKYIESIGLQACVITNCTRINGSIMEELVDQTNCIFQVTLDGANELTHALTRGRKNYGQVISFISELCSKKMSHRIHLRFNVTKNNYTEIPRLLEIAKNNKISNIYFGAIISTGRGIENYVESGIYGEYKAAIGVQKNLKELKDKYIKEFDISYPEPELSFGCALYQPQAPLTIKIDSCGYIYPCSLFTEPQFSIGNIYRDRLMIDKMRERINVIINQAIRKRTDSTDCKRCVCQALCKGGCLAVFLEEGCAAEHKDMCHIRQQSYGALFQKKDII